MSKESPNDIDKLNDKIKSLEQQIEKLSLRDSSPKVRATFIDRNGFEKVEYFGHNNVPHHYQFACTSSTNYLGSYRNVNECSRLCHERSRYKTFRLVHRTEWSAVYQEV